MKEKLDTAFAKSYLPSQNNLLPNVPLEARETYDGTDNILGRPQSIAMTHGIEEPLSPQKREDLPSSLLGKSATAKPYAPQTEDVNKLWAEELKNADERAANFREQLREMEKMKDTFENTCRELESRVGHRENEIRRLQGLYQGINFE